VDVRCLGGGELRGFSRYTLELIHALARRDSVDVVAISDVAIPFSLPVELHSVPGRREVAREQIGYVRAALRERLDVLLVPANRGVPWMTPCATVLTLHDAAEWDARLVDPPEGKSRARFTYASMLSLAGADLVITVSHASAAHIHQRLRVPMTRLRVVHEAPPRHFGESQPQSSDDVCARLGFSQGYVLYLGGFDTKKDVATLLRAFAKVIGLLPDAHLVLAGAATPDRLALEEHARELGLMPNIHWVGFVDDEDLQALYGSAACFVFPAVAEGFGLPVIEAMSCGTPVVVAEAGSLPEVVGDGGTCFPAGDDAALAGAVVSVLQARYEEGQRLSTAARVRAAQFTWDRTAEETEAVLREAAATQPTTRWRRRVLSFRHSWVRRPPSKRARP
jgi:glycosyltransferase involved in cell wall biosynthesis